MEKIQKFNKCRAFNKAVGPGKKNQKIIKVGPTFIPDYRVIQFIQYLIQMDWTERSNFLGGKC